MKEETPFDPSGVVGIYFVLGWESRSPFLVWVAGGSCDVCCVWRGDVGKKGSLVGGRVDGRRKGRSGERERGRRIETRIRKAFGFEFVVSVVPYCRVVLV